MDYPPANNANYPKRTKRKIIISVILVLVLAICILLCILFSPYYKYNKAKKLLLSGDYDEAYNFFSELDSYKDSKTYLENFIFCYDKEIQNNKVITEYTYDNCGNITKKTIKDPDDFTCSYSYEYYSDGKVKSKTYSLVDDIVKTTEFKYDENGYLIKETVYFPTQPPQISAECEYEYNDKGELLKIVGIKNKDSQTNSYEYDSQGKVIKKHTIVPSVLFEDYKTETEYTYHEKGYLLKETISDNNGAIVTFIYDSDGKILKKLYDNTKFPQKSEEKYSYNLKGQLTKVVYITDEKQEYTLTYEYEGEHIFYKPKK